ncbi:MAG: hypothetical protein RLZZ336_2114, partial [Cyanobacteriota bacterium]
MGWRLRRTGLVLLSFVVGLGLGVLVLACFKGPDPQRAAGVMTVNNRTSAAFERPAGGLSPAELARHDQADLVFDRSHVPLAGHPGAGLGPLFIANSCVACHVRNGRGRPVADEALVRLFPATTALGPQLQTQATYGHRPEAVLSLAWPAAAAPALRQPQVQLSPLPEQAPLPARLRGSLRVAPPLLGLGLLEQVPDAAITALADPDDGNGDGISGRPHWLDQGQGQRRLGRFGWKAIQPSVREQSAAAYNDDMGLTTPLNRHSDRSAAGLPADISNQELDLVTYYSQTLGAPRTDLPATAALVRQGRQLFDQMQCARCHVPQLRTGHSPTAVVQALQGQTIWPYSDLLLHDMGPGLDDGVPERGALSSEWRTPPLWGIGLAQTINPQAGFLHDGRARSLDEAIRWHGGEA